VRRVRWGQAERYCGEVGGRSDESAPDNDSPGVYTSGKVHGRCYRMRMLDQIHDLVVVADGGEGVGVWVRGAAEGSGLKRRIFVGASMGIELSPDVSAKAIPYGTEVVD